MPKQKHQAKKNRPEGRSSIVLITSKQQEPKQRLLELVLEQQRQRLEQRQEQQRQQLELEQQLERLLEQLPELE